MRARAQPQAHHSAFQQTLALGGDVAILANLPRTHLGVGINLFTLVATQLNFTGRNDALANLLGAFAARILAQLAVFHGGHIERGQGPGVSATWRVPRRSSTSSPDSAAD